MNQRKIDEMIPIALRNLNSTQDDFKNIKTPEGKIKSKYAGYIASFGPSVIHAGIAKTLAFYAKEGDADRETIANYIKHVLLEGNLNIAESNKGKKLLNLYLDETNGKPTLQKLNIRDKILEAATACKLAMYTYETMEDE
jgi:CRISPR/Cas system CMR-associated protein Cmr5 small subunit